MIRQHGEHAMDATTLDHLRGWVQRQFGENNGPILVAMIAQYLSDPEIYENTGWWRCYDDAGIKA